MLVGIHLDYTHRLVVVADAEGLEFRVIVAEASEEVGNEVVEALRLLRLFVGHIVVDTPFGELIRDVENLEVVGLVIKR